MLMKWQRTYSPISDYGYCIWNAKTGETLSDAYYFSSPTARDRSLDRALNTLQSKGFKRCQ